MFPKSTPETFASKLYQTYKSHKRITKPKLSRKDFIVTHYAGEVYSFVLFQLYFLLLPPPLSFLKFHCHVTQVLYQPDQFLEKNKDYVVPEHQDMLSASKCPFVAGLFPPVLGETPKSSKNAKFSSIGSRFKVVHFCANHLIFASRI